MQNLLQELKYLNLGPKMLYFSIYRLKFENTIAIFEIALQFV